MHLTKECFFSLPALQQGPRFYGRQNCDLGKVCRNFVLIGPVFFFSPQKEMVYQGLDGQLIFMDVITLDSLVIGFPVQRLNESQFSSLRADLEATVGVAADNGVP